MTTMNRVRVRSVHTTRRDQLGTLYLPLAPLNKTRLNLGDEVNPIFFGTPRFSIVASDYLPLETPIVQVTPFAQSGIFYWGMDSDDDVRVVAVSPENTILIGQNINATESDFGVLEATDASWGESTVLFIGVGPSVKAGGWQELGTYPGRSTHRFDIQIQHSIDLYMNSGPPEHVLSDVVGFLRWAQRSLKQVDVSVTDDGLLSLGARRPSGEQLFVEIDRDGVVEAALFGAEEGIKALDIHHIAELPWILSKK